MSQQFVNIKEGFYRSAQIQGVFPLITRARKAYQNPPDGIEKTHRVEVLDSTNKKIGVWVDESDVEYLTAGDVAQSDLQEKTSQLTDDVLRRAIADRFEMMHTLTDGVIEGHINSMIVSGSPGVGKTFTLNAMLKAAEDRGDISKYVLFGGHVSPLGLYQLLYENSSEGNVIVLDDTDCVFFDEDTMGMLKIALDSGDERVLRWMSHSKILSEQDIPTEFTYEGSVIFISNMDFERIIASGSKLAPHMEALMSRSVFLDLLIHGIRETLLRIEHVVLSTNMLDKVGITDMDDKYLLLDWLKENQNHLRAISLREVLRLAKFYQMDPAGWTRIAQATLFKPSAQRLLLTGGI